MKSEGAVLDLLQYINSMGYEFNDSILSEKAETVSRLLESTPFEAERWVSVEERLPDNERRVLILYVYKDQKRLIPFVAEYNPFEEKWRNVLQDITICYWMDIAPPPADGKGEEG